MKNNLKQAQKHISDLVNQDNADSDKLDAFYQQALLIIKSNIQAFYQQYATENRLSLNQVSSSVNSWDMQQFKRAINQFMLDTPDNDDLKQRIFAAKALAGTNKSNLIGAIISIGIATASAKAQQYGQKQLINQYVDEYNYRNPNSKISSMDVPSSIKKAKDFINKIWANNDLSTIRAKQQVHKSITKGLDRSSLNQLNKNSDDTNTSNNLDSSANAGISFNKQLLRSSNIDANNEASSAAYSDNQSIVYLQWVTQDDDKVCDICEPMNGNIYTVEDAPTPQEDSHYNCRCLLEPSDKDGNILDL
ncbi:minor capsid protein (plasmid) [Apilactobacillus apisilvae]|uniref:Minor capsid protein n=1 Tax=Apilactobacillus apisilvae TaxID=2923364 RepID=A0ABY4PIW7_9LACO|nr:minor capsid protein [Apilactobacillus apisilvae]UQS85775.1 minor capsid protein [Apilactobacillus apisilvae]